MGEGAARGAEEAGWEKAPRRSKSSSMDDDAGAGVEVLGGRRELNPPRRSSSSSSSRPERPLLPLGGTDEAVAGVEDRLEVVGRSNDMSKGSAEGEATAAEGFLVGASKSKSQGSEEAGLEAVELTEAVREGT